MNKYLTYILFLASCLSFLTACSKSDEEAIKDTKQQISFSATAQVGNSSNQTTTKAGTSRGYWENPESSTSQISTYLWDGNDKVSAAVVETSSTDGTSNFTASLLATDPWDATVTPASDKKSATISWQKDLTIHETATSGTIYKYCQFFVANATTGNNLPSSVTGYLLGNTFRLPDKVSDNTFSTGISPIPYTQTGYNNLQHLKSYSFLYSLSDADAWSTISKKNINFTYIPVIIRFVVTNSTGSGCTIKCISLVSNHEVFHMLGFGFLYKVNNDCHYNIGNLTDNGSSYGVMVNVDSPTSLANNDKACLYAMTLPSTWVNINSSTEESTSTTSINDTYKIYVKVLHDNGTEATYSAGSLTGEQLRKAWYNSDTNYKFESGHSYTLNIKVNKTTITVTPGMMSTFPGGWGTSDDENITAGE